MPGSLDPALLDEESERIGQVMQLLRGFLRQPTAAPNAELASQASNTAMEVAAEPMETLK